MKIKQIAVNLDYFKNEQLNLPLVYSTLRIVQLWDVIDCREFRISGYVTYFTTQHNIYCPRTRLF